MDLTSIKDHECAIVNTNLIPREEIIKYKGENQCVILINIPIYKVCWINISNYEGGSHDEIGIISKSGVCVYDFPLNYPNIYGFSKEHILHGNQEWKYKEIDLLDDIIVMKGYFHNAYLFLTKEKLGEILSGKYNSKDDRISVEIIHAV